MTPTFDPLKNNELPISSIILYVQDDNTLEQKEKSVCCCLWNYLGKLIRWIFNPSMHMSKVRDVFETYLSVDEIEQNKKSRSLKERANLYVNCTSFNKEVVDKRNQSCWSCLPCVKENNIDTIRLYNLSIMINRSLFEELKALKQPLDNDNIDLLATVTNLKNTLLILEDTAVIDQEDINETRGLIQESCKQRINALNTHISAKANAIQNNKKQFTHKENEEIPKLHALIKEINQLSLKIEAPQIAEDPFQTIIDEARKQQTACEELIKLIQNADEITHKDFDKETNDFVDNQYVFTETKETLKQMNDVNIASTGVLAELSKLQNMSKEEEADVAIFKEALSKLDQLVEQKTTVLAQQPAVLAYLKKTIAEQKGLLPGMEPVLEFAKKWEGDLTQSTPAELQQLWDDTEAACNKLQSCPLTHNIIKKAKTIWITHRRESGEFLLALENLKTALKDLENETKRINNALEQPLNVIRFEVNEMKNVAALLEKLKESKEKLKLQQAYKTYQDLAVSMAGLVDKVAISHGIYETANNLRKRKMAFSPVEAAIDSLRQLQVEFGDHPHKRAFDLIIESYVKVLKSPVKVSFEKHGSKNNSGPGSPSKA